MVTRRTLNRLIGGACALATTGGFTTRTVASSASDIAFAPAPPDIWDSHGSVRRAGGRLHYATLGTPGDQPPVVLLHKLGGWVADWRGVAPALAKDRLVIAIDLPGHGASTWDGAPPEVQSVHETAMLVRGTLEELGRTMGFSKVHLAGSSLGGCVAIALAALCPQLVERLALPSCVLGTARTWDEVMAKEAGQAGMFTPQGDPLPSAAALSRAVFHLDNAPRIAAEQNTSRRIAGRWIRPQERGVALTDFPTLMRQVEAPTLLLYGERDTFFLIYREEAEAQLRDVRSVILPDASGFPVQDQPAATGAALAAFLAGQAN